MSDDPYEDERDRCVYDPLWAHDEIVRLRATQERILTRLRTEADEAGTYGRREGLLRAIFIVEEEIGHE